MRIFRLGMRVAVNCSVGRAIFFQASNRRIMTRESGPRRCCLALLRANDEQEGRQQTTPRRGQGRRPRHGQRVCFVPLDLTITRPPP